MVDKDYANFAARMGSFEDTLEINDNEELKHYGVLGMRWGRRKAQSGYVNTVNKKTGEVTERRMSNKELNAKLKRLRLEAEFDRLSTKPSTIPDIEKIAKKAGAIVTMTTGAITLYNNINTIIDISKKVSKAINKGV